MLTVQQEDSTQTLLRQQLPGQQGSRPEGEELEVWRRYLRTHAAITKQLDAEMIRDHEISLSEFEVLLLLSRAPGGQMRLIRLAEQALVTRSGMTRLITRLEDRGFVERVRCPSDRRGYNAQLTEAGAGLLEQARSTHLAGVDRLFVAPLGDELASLGASLERLPESPEEQPPDCDAEG
jgi:DNA-binding MarR family transcriptional regulator